MLLLPRVEQPLAQIRSPWERPIRSSQGERPTRSSQGEPLKSCFHLCGKSGVELTGKEAEQRPSTAKEKVASKTGGARTPRSNLTSDGRGRTDAASLPLGPLSETRSTMRFNGVEGISLSLAGNWLDSRAFRESCEAAGATAANLGGGRVTPRAVKKKRGELSEGERFVLKRFKEVISRKHHSPQIFWKKLLAYAAAHNNGGADGVSITSFVGALSGLLKENEAKVIFRLLDVSGNGSISALDFLVVLDEV